MVKIDSWRKGQCMGKFLFDRPPQFQTQKRRGRFKIIKEKIKQQQQKTPKMVFYGCCHNLLKTSWLRATQIYDLAVLEVRSPKSVLLSWNSRCHQARTHSEDSRGDCFLTTFRGCPLALALGPSLCLPSQQGSIIRFCLCCFQGHISFSDSLVSLPCDHISLPRESKKTSPSQNPGPIPSANSPLLGQVSRNMDIHL